MGDIELLKDEAVYQRNWPLGRVEKIYPGADGKSRVVDVFVKGRTYRRPVTRLVYLLEEETSLSSLGGGCLGHRTLAFIMFLN